MNDQQTKITGYRALTEAEIDLMNQVKEMAMRVGEMCEVLKQAPGIDSRWLSIGATQLQQGFMAVNRAIAKPTTF